MLRSALVTVALSFVGVAPLTAQCVNTWLPSAGPAGLDQRVTKSAVWDPDGAGPLTPRLAVGGTFTVAGGVAANRVAAWDPATGTWSALGAGFPGVITALGALPNGHLVAGVESISGPSVVFRLHLWNGAVWSQIAQFGGLAAVTLAALPNGDLVAGGGFIAINGPAVQFLGRWNGATWSQFGQPTGSVNALAVMPNGDLIVCGAFSSIGGVSATRVARWSGGAWHALGAGLGGAGTGEIPTALAVHPSGDLIAGGYFTSAGGAPALGVARWDGSTWTPLGAGVAPQINAVAALPNGEVVVAGDFSVAGGVPAMDIARWDGSTWSSLGTGTTSTTAPAVNFSWVSSLTTMPNGDLFAGGSFPTMGGVGANNAALWNGSAWSAPNPGTNAPVLALASTPGGDVIAGGLFDVIGGAAARSVARRVGGVWQPLGGGTNGIVYAVATLPGGDVVAGGDFTMAGGVPASRVARWDGSAWSPLGAGCNGAVTALLPLSNGDLLAAGAFGSAGGAPAARIARWDGSTWTPLGSGITGNLVWALALQPNGDVIAGGDFTAAGGAPAASVARWNGAAWSAMGSGFTAPVKALLVQPNGDVLAGGDFTITGGSPATGVARWQGSVWQPLGAFQGQTAALALLPDGDVVAAGPSATQPAAHIARWNGILWVPLAATGTNLYATSLATLPNGDLVVGGGFSLAGGAASASVADVTTTCPATAVATGGGCPSSGGANVLAATALPWLGGTFRAQATGVPQQAIVVAVSSVQPLAPGSTPLAALLPQGVPGCELRVGAELLDLVLAAGGVAESQLVLPTTAALAGVVFHHQMIPCELDGSGAIVAITATNALQLTCGVF